MFSCLFALGYVAGGFPAAVDAGRWKEWAHFLEDNHISDHYIDEYNLYFRRIADALGASAVSEAVIIKCI